MWDDFIVSTMRPVDIIWLGISNDIEPLTFWGLILLLPTAHRLEDWDGRVPSHGHIAKPTRMWTARRGDALMDTEDFFKVLQGGTPAAVILSVEAQ